jgi:hypothetical protein
MLTLQALAPPPDRPHWHPRTHRPTPPRICDRRHGSRSAAHHQPWTAPAWVTAGSLLATSLAGLVGYRRRRRDRKVRRGQAVPPTDPNLVRRHSGVRVAEEPAGVERADTALRMLAVLLVSASTPTRAPIPQALLRRPDGTVDVFLREPGTAPPPPPWTVTAGGRIWTLPAGAPVTRPEPPPPCPALVQLASTDDGAEFYVDLKALGVRAADAD